MPELKEIVSARVKKHRNGRNLTQEELAEKAGLHPTYVAKIECGTRGCSLNTIQKISDALEIPPQALLGPVKKENSYVLKNKPLKEILTNGSKDEKETVFTVAETLLKKRK
jgi:transcriptional regulator with XRE-family HTH domain